MTKKQIAKRSLERKLKKRDEQFDKLWMGIVKDVNNYVGKHEILSKSEVSHGSISRLIDNLCLSGAWVNDRLTGYTSWSGTKYRGSLNKKIRKVLGYKI